MEFNAFQHQLKELHAYQHLDLFTLIWALSGSIRLMLVHLNTIRLIQAHLSSFKLIRADLGLFRKIQAPLSLFRQI